MSEITNPHDSFFRKMFSRKEIATNFLSTYLPKQIIQQVDLDTLAISKDSFVDKELQHHFSDLLYTVKHRQKDLHLYLLFEHKSSKRYTEKDILEILDQTSIEDNIMKTFIDEYIEQGRKKGRKEGIQQGMQQAGYKILSTQLTHRFGTLPKWVTEKIDSADMDTLEKWSLRLLSAKKLDEVFH